MDPTEGDSGRRLSVLFVRVMSSTGPSETEIGESPRKNPSFSSLRLGSLIMDRTQ